MKKENIDKITRENTENRKLQVLWESLREIGKDDIVDIIKPLIERKMSKKERDYFLKLYLKKHSLGMDTQNHLKLNKSLSPKVSLTMEIDFSKTITQLSNEFKEFVAVIKKTKKWDKVDKFKTKKSNRQKPHGYYPEDFDVYREINAIKAKTGKMPSFYALARKRIKDDRPAPKDVEKEKNKLESAYNRAKWYCEEDGYLTLL